MTTIEYISNSEADTDRLGTILAKVFAVGSVVALDGTLGAGKTRLVQAIAAAMGVPRDRVLSPTFVLCHQYPGEITIYHLDAYRINDLDEFFELGIDEMIDAGGLVFIEWANKISEGLPPNRYQINITATGETQRAFAITATGEAESQALEQARPQFEESMGQK